MEIRVLDEVVDISGFGVLLLTTAQECKGLVSGSRIRDIRGNKHIVDDITLHDSIASLFIRDGDLDYFERLFRDVLVDATLFTLCEPEAET